MPRVHFVRKARKDNSAVKKGESYYGGSSALGQRCIAKQGHLDGS